MAALTPESFTRARGRVVSVALAAADSKRRREDVVPVPASVAAEVGRFLKGCPAGRPVFEGWDDWHTRGARMVAADLAAAGLPYTDAAGARFDFHALRVQYVTSLARAGVGLVAAQHLARHSTPALTATVYSRYAPGELAAAADKLRRPAA